MKKLVAILIILSIMLTFIPTYAEIIYPPGTVDEAVQRANGQIGSEYYNIKMVNKEVWEKYGALVYGNPHGTKKGDEYRYLGYTPEGAEYTNYIFPHDDWGGGYLEDRNWIETPWNDDYCRSQGAKENPFNNKAAYEPAIEEGLRTAYGDYMKGTKNDWYKYMQILQPPTDFTPGMGRMWQTSKWYITVPIAPLKIGFLELTKETYPLDWGYFCEDELDAGVRYVHYNEKKEKVTFKIYEFSTSKRITDYHILPNDSKLIKTVSFDFSNDDVFWFDIGELKNPIEEGGGITYSTGYFVTSSESNFKKGVLIRKFYDKEIPALGTDFHKAYYPDTSVYDNKDVVYPLYSPPSYKPDRYGYFSNHHHFPTPF